MVVVLGLPIRVWLASGCAVQCSGVNLVVLALLGLLIRVWLASGCAVECPFVNRKVLAIALLLRPGGLLLVLTGNDEEPEVGPAVLSRAELEDAFVATSYFRLVECRYCSRVMCNPLAFFFCFSPTPLRCSWVGGSSKDTKNRNSRSMAFARGFSSAPHANIYYKLTSQNRCYCCDVVRALTPQGPAGLIEHRTTTSYLSARCRTRLSSSVQTSLYQQRQPQRGCKFEWCPTVASGCASHSIVTKVSPVYRLWHGPKSQKGHGDAALK